jgi:hypothetical protein
MCLVLGVAKCIHRCWVLSLGKRSDRLGQVVSSRATPDHLVELSRKALQFVRGRPIGSGQVDSRMTRPER